ncbi:hypothetical protein D3C84_861520 [compost metagenome]
MSRTFEVGRIFFDQRFNIDIYFWDVIRQFAMPIKKQLHKVKLIFEVFNAQTGIGCFLYRFGILGVMKVFARADLQNICVCKFWLELPNK